MVDNLAPLLGDASDLESNPSKSRPATEGGGDKEDLGETEAPTDEAPIEGGTDDEKAAAALKIQSLHRGKRDRAKVEEKRAMQVALLKEKVRS